MRCHADIQRHNTGGREQGHLFAPPVVIAIAAVFIVPEIAIHRIAAVIGFLAKLRFSVFVAFQCGNIGDSALQLVEERVQVNRDELSGAYAGKTACIA